MPFRCLRTSPDLDAAILLRQASLGYPSLASYLRGLIRQDIYQLPSHRLSRIIASDPPWKRDAIDAALLRHLVDSVSRGGG